MTHNTNANDDGCDTTSDKLEKRIDSGYLDTSVNGRESYFAIVIVLILIVELNAIFYDTSHTTRFIKVSADGDQVEFCAICSFSFMLHKFVCYFVCLIMDS